MKLTPMLQQYLSIKEEYKDCILFFRMGDFYETFFEDAILVSRELGIVLTSRDKENNVPLAGVPWHAADGYLKRLVMRGYKVAICEQMEEPQSGRIVERRVVRIVTPGTWLGEDNEDTVFIASLCFRGGVYGVAFCNVGSGDFEVGEFLSDVELRGVISGYAPTEVLIPDNNTFLGNIVSSVLSQAVISPQPEGSFSPELSRKMVSEQFNVVSVDALGCGDMSAGLAAAGALLSYLKSTQMTEISHLKPLKPLSDSKYMFLDAATQRNLALVEGEITLFTVMDRTSTPMGRRLLKRWLLRPLRDKEMIVKRQEAVEFFFRNSHLRYSLKELLSSLGDLERTCSRIGLERGTVFDMFSVRDFLRALLKMKETLDVDKPSLLEELLSEMDPLSDLLSFLDSALVEEYTGERFIRKGFNKELDETYNGISESKKWLEELEERERKLTGIKNLKVGYNKVFGYYIEVSKSNLHLVPERYHRKQTLVGGERFITLELKEKEAFILEAEKKIEQLVSETASNIFGQIKERLGVLQKDVEIVSRIDLFISLAQLAVDNRYTRPKISDGDEIHLVAARHPVIEKIKKDSVFVANDCYLNSSDQRVIILTGPNMAGKSTYLRQVALIVLMAQMGSFVPADSAHIGVVDRVFTRIGSRDELERGQSTFMVEMNEVSNILRNATQRSLVILDEVGRGTSTYDGLSIAWAMIEYLHDRIGAKVLFATHYHELTALEGKLYGVKNYHMMVKEKNGDLVFLWKIGRGSAEKSYGIEVARIVGLPGDIIVRASEILKKLEKTRSLMRKRVKQKMGTLFGEEQ